MDQNEKNWEWAVTPKTTIKGCAPEKNYNQIIYTRKVSLSVVRMTKSYFLFVFSNVIELFYFLFENTLFSLVFGFDSTSGIAVLYTAGIECSWLD